jgi:hypothetical protein
VVATVLTADVSGNAEVKFATAVGGLAIAALLGIRRFDTVRAAASLAVTILAIGVITFPGATDIVGKGNVGVIIGFLGR